MLYVEYVAVIMRNLMPPYYVRVIVLELCNTLTFSPSSSMRPKATTSTLSHVATSYDVITAECELHSVKPIVYVGMQLHMIDDGPSWY